MLYYILCIHNRLSYCLCGLYIFNTEHYSQYDESVQSLQKPTEIYDPFWVSISIPTPDKVKELDFLGKWLVFRHYDEIDETWQKIRTAIVTDNLQGCVHALCSTMRYNPTQEGPGPSTTGVICVYTEEHNINAIGFKLIEIVQQDIKYKTESDTLAGKYAHTGDGKVTIKTIFWNNGRPSFVCEGKPCYGTSRYKEDIWHLNVVEAPKEFIPQEIFGRWILELENEELSPLWHILKDKIECKTDNLGVAAMVCPPKRNRRSAEEQVVFLLYVGKEWKDSVGYKLIDLVETDIMFEQKRKSDSDSRRFHPYETLYWNNGEPAYRSVESLRKPTEIYDSFWVSISIPTPEEVKEIDFLGKWLVFKHYDEIDETWEKIRTAVVTDNLQGCVHAICSTMRYDPTQEGPGPSTTGVICVFTEEHNIDAIGFKLIEIVQQDIKYKTRKYVRKGDGKVTIKTIFWNNGRPSFVCEGKPCYGTSRDKEDIWHLNVVEAPKEFAPKEIFGRWIVEVENEDLTELWHILKEEIKCKTENFGVAGMECPPKRNRRSTEEQAVFLLYVGKEWKDSVGYKLIDFVETDIVFERKRRSDSDSRRSHRYETLYWNNGEPAYEIVTRPGITKNWRTGEDV